jgi:hypothetical protein
MPGEAPSCLSATLQNSDSLAKNADVTLCAPDYAPFSGKLSPDAMARFFINVPFRDPGNSSP